MKFKYFNTEEEAYKSIEQKNDEDHDFDFDLYCPLQGEYCHTKCVCRVQPKVIERFGGDNKGKFYIQGGHCDCPILTKDLSYG